MKNLLNSPFNRDELEAPVGSSDQSVLIYFSPHPSFSLALRLANDGSTNGTWT
jgi:hypothetical protein